MRVGKFRNLIEVQRFVVIGKDELGGDVGAWQIFKKVWAEIAQWRGSTAQSADFQRYQKATVRFRARWSEVQGVAAPMRISYGGEVYEIRSILPDDQMRHDCLIETTVQDRTAGANG